MDVVLGDAAQRFIVADVQALDGVLRDLGDLDGRVGFVPLNAQRAIPPGPTPPHTLAAFAQAELPGLVDLLLGNVLLADDLPMARALASAYPGYRIVTRAGELLEPDGTLTVGPPQADMGMLSRKSELRDLREQIAVLEGQIERLAADQADDRQQAEALEGPIAALQAEIDTLEGVADTLRDRMVVQREKQARLQDQMELLTSESAILTDEVHKAEQAWHQARQQAEAEDATARTLKARLAEADQAMKTAAAARETRQQEHTEAQVALGRVQQQLAALKARAASLDSEVRQRKVEAVGLAAQERASRVRQTELTLTILRATAQAADAYRDKEEREQRVLELNTRREHLRTTLDQVQTDLSSIRDSSSARREQAHRHELTVKELQGRRDAVADRMRDDYEIDLAAYLTSSPEGSESPDMASSPPARETHAEIEDLRRKIAKLGSVNLEALEQLTAEETREREIRTQHDDLVHAETSLLEIIEQINADSRKLFMETLTSVRVHFQELFRKLFGGGMADIVLENEVDVLESGIEITARPPGKELRSISLLSGGEKTLTAVALLLAIFRSKPSPFCLLDEVDAALDEANAVRLAGVIQEFREQSQFIIITHKKRTMAAADVLHGVTMQESGVSKRIAIRFEDWPDDPPEIAERQGAA
jgi:chromosome segregation protein